LKFEMEVLIYEYENMIKDVHDWESIVYVWRNSMSLMGRFYGGVNLVYALDYGFK